MPHSPFSLSTLIPPDQLKTLSISALLLHADRILLGTATGTLLVYDLTSTRTGFGSSSSSAGTPTASFVSKHDDFTKTGKAIDQLGAVKELNALVCLSGGDVTLHSLPDLSRLPFSPPTKSVASLFILSTTIFTPPTKPTEIHTTIAIAARRKLLLNYWKDGTLSRSEEVNLPHQIRGMAFVEVGENTKKIVAGFSTGEYGIVTLPPPPSTSNAATPSNATSSPLAAATLGELFIPHLPTEVLSSIITPTSLPTESNQSKSGGVGMGLGSLAKVTGLGALANFGMGNKVEKNGVVGVPGWEWSLKGLKVGSGKGKGKEKEKEKDKGEEGVDRMATEWIWEKEWDDDVKDGEVLVLRESKRPSLPSRLFQDSKALEIFADLVIPLLPTGKLRPSNPPQPATVIYPSTADETLVLPPYVLSLIPNPPPKTGTTLQVHSIDSLAFVQILNIPPNPKSPPTSPSLTPSPAPPTSSETASITSPRLLTSNSTSPKAPFLFVTSTVPATGGVQQTTPPEQKVWIGQSRSWEHQIEEMGSLGEWEKAIRLVRRAGFDAVGEISPKLLRRLGILHALHLFRTDHFDQSIDRFITFSLSPAKVVALYPSAISGKLCLAKFDQEEWFGGRSAEKVREEVEAHMELEQEGGDPSGGAEKHETTSTAAASLRGARSWRREHHEKPEETEARVKREKEAAVKQEKQAFTKSVDVLIRYLTDRRQKYAQALSSLRPSSRPSPSDKRPPIGQQELLELPDVPLKELKPDQLARVAQVVDTALFKSYLATKPVMVGPLCRIENWCEVEEVEELLLAAKKFRELLDLYNGKSMHEKAVKLLRKMSDDEDDQEEKVGPTIRYLQKLGSEHVGLIFESSKWVFEVDRKAGLQIFIADLEEVETLPRHATMAHLERIGPDVCASYLEHIIHRLSETGAEFHEKLIELYLASVTPSKAQTTDEAYQKLLALLKSSTSYRADRILGRLPSDDMYEVRAILLGRLGRHEGALQIYVYQLDDHATAEEYCKRVYDSDPDMRSTIFHILLRIYLRPRPNHPLLFTPALSLISAHASSIDAVEVFELLPPLVALSDIRVFLEKTLRRSGERSREAKVLKGISRSWVEEGEREVVNLEERRVKITESRVCPQCYKRLGNSVIAIHSPMGQVTHYQCREDFQASLQRLG